MTVVHHQQRIKREPIAGPAMRLGTDIGERLAFHASRRGISIQEIARRILDAVTDDGLVDAVLDDKHEWETAE